MMSIIDKIYNGDYYPAEEIKPDSDSFRKHSSTVQALSTQLKSILSKEQFSLFEEYMCEVALVTDLYNLEFYRAGVQFGVRLILEALCEKKGPERADSDARPTEPC